jgi:hypothetical protein
MKIKVIQNLSSIYIFYHKTRVFAIIFYKKGKIIENGKKNLKNILTNERKCG